MDILEVWTSTNRSHQGMAWRESGRVRWDDYNQTTPLPTDWTTYGMEWGPGYQVYFINGQLKKRVDGDHVTDVDHYILLNSGVESGMPPSAATVFPNAFEIDYVRVYERPGAPVVHNAGFEQPAAAPWKPYGQCTLVSSSALSGKQALRVDGASGAEQKVYGLRANSRYILSAKVRVGHESTEARIGVKRHGTPEVFSSASTQGVSEVRCEFSTGAESSGGVIYCYVPESSGLAFFDDVTLIPAGAAP
jgi:beta-glucanase (GH16 family)